MATTENFYTGNASTTSFGYSFPILQNSDLKVELDGVEKTENTSGTNNDYSISGTNVVFNSAPGQDVDIHIYRHTNVDSGKAVFAAGSSIRAGDLNNNLDQSLYSNQEQHQKIKTSDVRDIAVTTAKIKDLNVTRAKIANDAIDGTKIADDSIDSEHYVAGSIDLEHMSANSVDSNQYVDGSIDRVHLAADIVDGTKIADNSIDSEHYVDGSIDQTHLSNSAVGSNQIANNAVTTTEILNGAVTSDKLATDSVITAKIANTAVTNAKLATDSVTTPKIADSQVTTAKIANNAVVTSKIADNVISNSKMTNDSITAAEIADNAVITQGISDNAVTNAKIAAGSITSDKLNGATVVTNSEQAASTPNDTSFFTTAAAEARYFNASTGETIKDGQTFPDNDTTIATTAAINDRIIDLVDDVGGFVPIANETSFPTANPDVNGGAGTIVSVKAASTNLAPSGTTVTIANGRGSGLAVIITGVSATIPSGFGFLVETTTTDHTYAFHRLVPKATEVTTVAGKSTEIGRLGTAAAVEDMSILGTTDVVADMAILGTTDVVADMNTLGTADVVSDMNTLAVTSVVNNMDTVATNVANVNNVGGSISNVNTTAGSIANVNTVAGSIANVNTTAGSISNVNTTAGSISNVNTVASNISSVNNFFNVYRIGANNPTSSLDVGDLFFNTTSNSLKVYTGSAWVDGVTATGNFAVVTGNTFTGSNVYNDNAKALFGTGSDLEIYHDGSHSHLVNNTGNLRILADGSGELVLTSKAGEEAIVCAQDGSVELMYDNSKKLETNAQGIVVSGDINLTFANGYSLFADQSGNLLRLGDNIKLQLGNAGDLQIYHDGSESVIGNSTGTLQILSPNEIRYRGTTHHFLSYGNDETMAKFIDDGAVELYHNNTKMFETTADGATLQKGLTVKGVEGGEAQIRIEADEADNASDRFRLVATDSAGFNIQSYDGSQYDTLFKGVINGGVELSYNNSKKFETTSTGVSVTGSISSSGNISLVDTGALQLGTSNDFTLTHNGTNSVIDNNTGDLIIRGDADDVKILAEDDILLRDNDDSTNFIHCVNGGSVDLYHNGSKKFETTSTGATLTGALTTTGNINVPTGNGIVTGSITTTGSTAFTAVDNGIAYFGTGNDLRIYHDGSHSNIVDSGTGNLRIFGDSQIFFGRSIGGEAYASFNSDDAVNLYFDNAIKFSTTSTGVTTTGTMFFDGGSDGSVYIRGAGSDIRFTNGSWTGNSANAKIQQYNSYLYIFGGSNGIIFRENGTDRWLIDGSGHFIPNADSTYNIGSNSVRVANGYFDTLYGDGSNLTGISSVGGSTGVDFNDNVKARFGTGNDFEIFHDGTTNRFQSSGLKNFQFNPKDTDKGLEIIGDGTVRLYYDGNEKFATTSTGVEVQGRYAFNSNNYITCNTSSNTMEFVVGGNQIGEFNSGQFTFLDNKEVRFGNSNDFRIYHDGSNNYINSVNGNLYLQQSSQNKAIVKGGALSPGNENIDLGESGLRWQNVHAKRYHGDGVLQARIAYETVSTYSIYDSYGVSSLGDNGTGLSDVNFTTSYADNTYTINANGQQDAGGGGRFCTFKNPDSDGSHCEIEFRAFNNGLLDAVRICAMFSGDQP